MSVVNARRGRPPGLTREQIVDVALNIARTNRLAGVSLRTVADQLGVHQTTLYTYVGSKDGLIRAMLDAVFVGGLTLPAADDPRPPRDQLEDIVHQLHEIAADHVELLGYVGRTASSEAAPLRALETMFSLLARMGLETEQQVQAYNLLYLIVVGGGLLTGNRRLSDDSEPQVSNVNDVAGLTADYPFVARAAEIVNASDDPPAAQLQSTLQLVLDVVIPGMARS